MIARLTAYVCILFGLVLSAGAVAQGERPTLEIAPTAARWPSGCDSFFSNQFGTGYAHGYCSQPADGRDEFRTRVRCTREPGGQWVTRWGAWEETGQGVISDAQCGPNFPTAFHSAVFGRD